MAPKKKRARKHKRKTYDDAENASQSESTNLNDASDSWECPTSARKNLTENSKAVSNLRRSSLRSAAKPIQNGITSAPDDIQQVDDPAETVDSGYKGLDKDSEKKESPSRYLVSCVSSPTLELIPLEKDLEGEITNDNQRKCTLRGGCSSPSYGLKLSEMVAMVGNENGDEVDSEIPSRAEDTVNGYHVKMEFMPILRRIIDKHGDIARNCVTESVRHRSELLEIICGIISDFEKKDVRSIKGSSLKDKIALVDGLRNMKVEVEWLHARLTEVLEANEILMQSSELKQKAAKNRKLVEQSELELEECEAQKKELTEKLKTVCEKETLCKENLARAKDESAATSRVIGFAISKVGRFLNCSMVDALI
ncbi:uncharacterized protein LOC127121094 [Lathyrus oleraceus]|uniref:Phospholipase-like protein n=1 Tax=Pisum sativum TaxID=3888 RepID=A0A9D4Y696_PEA|nr:uncharacterized protein LOC127121094 [Pisum sativum]KAI5433547.1 hypothetical protein KIW84_020728 [Pisum sativum]